MTDPARPSLDAVRARLLAEAPEALEPPKRKRRPAKAEPPPLTREQAFRASKLRLVQAGKRGGGPVPYGYRKTGRGGAIEPRPPEADVVRMIFRLYLARYGTLEKVQVALDRAGIYTRSGAHWSRPAITWLLRNPVYRGSVRWGDASGPGRHEAIVDALTFNKAAQKLAANRKKPLSPTSPLRRSP